MTSAPVASEYTCAFVTGSLPPDARRVLELGCGEGELAAALGSKGLDVRAVDSDPANVAVATGRGVAATLLEWPGELGERFDAILFTRSLHHMHDLEGSLDAARRHVRPGGIVLVEDFRSEGAGEASAIWFTGIARVLAAAGALPDDFDAAAKLATPQEHELHSSSAIRTALGRIGRVEEQSAAYYFRYFEPFLSRAASEQMLAHELALIGSLGLEPLGKRFIVRPA